ncbi:hypothetical protein ACLBR5_06605 [Escherichia coli]
MHGVKKNALYKCAGAAGVRVPKRCVNQNATLSFTAR